MLCEICSARMKKDDVRWILLVPVGPFVVVAPGTRIHEVVRSIVAAGGTRPVVIDRERCAGVVFMDAGQIIEANEPHEFFANPQHARTKLFLSQILH